MSSEDEGHWDNGDADELHMEPLNMKNIPVHYNNSESVPKSKLRMLNADIGLDNPRYAGVVKKATFDEDLSDGDIPTMELDHEYVEVTPDMELASKLRKIEETEAEDIQITSEQTSSNRVEQLSKQRSAWEFIMDVRIKMQECVELANCLPEPKMYSLFTDAESKKVETVEGLRKTLGSLVAMNRTMRGAKPGAPLGKSLTSIWETIDSEANVGTNKQLDVLEKWRKKTRMAQGGFRKSKVTLEAIDQSLQEQVEGILKNKKRLLDRTMVRRSDYHIIGSKRGIATENSSPFIFDDTDFLQRQLRDLSNVGTSVTIAKKLAKSVHGSKKRGKRAKTSKDRTVRYNVHSELLNFMAPVRFENEHHLAVTMFVNLFQ